MTKETSNLEVILVEFPVTSAHHATCTTSISRRVKAGLEFEHTPFRVNRFFKGPLKKRLADSTSEDSRLMMLVERESVAGITS